MGQPADRVALAAAGRMLDQVVVARAFAYGPHPPACARPAAGGNAGRSWSLSCTLRPVFVALLFDLQVQEPSEQIQQAVSLQHLLPQVGRAVGAALRDPAGCPRRRRSPLLNGRNCVAVPASRVVMNTASVSTAKWTSVRRLNSKIGSRGSRSWLVLPLRVVHRLAGQRILELQRWRRGCRSG